MGENWIDRWQKGRTGWHEPDGNAGLRRHWRAGGKRVLVPLCGKSPDLVWLAGQGNAVTGVELSELAVKSFFDEQQLEYEPVAAELPAFRAREMPITIYCGDFFALTAVDCDAHYDRGALVALAPGMRQAYVNHLDRLLPDGVYRLVVALDYDQRKADGPPFSVEPGELLSYWPELECVDRYDDIENGPPKFREAGLAQMFESVWRTP